MEKINFLDLISRLDDYASIVDPYEYGLPMFESDTAEYEKIFTEWLRENNYEIHKKQS